ncbi:hypothetical protein DF186_23150, partial [Enterococcus hirae]
EGVIRGVGLPVGRRRVEEQNVDFEVQQVRDREEHRFLQLADHGQEHVHGPVAGIIGHPGKSGDVHPLGDPCAPGQLRQRC